ncbi:putative short chain type dehydrogenase [Clavulina sp. PMI_390]|nr:putative short chain type dehydrogenase [Clavulina sp. PMI_390]
MSLAGKVAIVTGGSQGIGKAISLALAKDGATVIVNYSRSKGPADATVHEIHTLTSNTSSAVAIQANVGILADVKSLVDQTVKQYGKIDFLICNAGKIYGNTGLNDTTEALFDEAFNLNVKGVYFMIQEAAPHIPSGGRIILFSSSLTFHTQIPPTHLLYASTKGAIEQMSRVLAKDLGRRGITVNTVSPGPTATDGFFEGKTDEMVSFIEKWAPSGRLGKPEEISGTVKFLCTEEAAWVNGQTIAVNGAAMV